MIGGAKNLRLRISYRIAAKGGDADFSDQVSTRERH
jgi:hypothetical protein